MSKDYTASNIKVLKGLEAVRKRPGMYIGGTGVLGLHHLVKEIVDNSIDEALIGHCDKIDIKIYEDGSVSIKDNGRGIPIDTHEEGKSAAEIIFTVLHAGGKFDKNSYKVSGGLHGVGASVVNALSKKVEIRIYRQGFEYELIFENQKKKGELKKIGQTKEKGTYVRFWPDEKIFSTVKFDYNLMKTRYRECAYLNSNITITLEDERVKKKEVFHYEGGLSQFVEFLSKNSTKIIDSPISITGEKEGQQIDCAFTYTNGYNERIDSFVNNITTPGGGTHVSGFKLALTKAIKDYITKNNLIKDKTNLSGDDIREGILCVISVKISEPQFEGQTKDKLGNPEVQNFVNQIVYEKFYEFLDANPKKVNIIVQKAVQSNKAREAAKKARDLVKRKSSLEFSSLPGKLCDCSSKDPKESELFLVEGDSAGGSAKQGRNRHTQAILPLRGKVINVEKARIIKVLENNEIGTIINTLGCGFSDNFNIEKLRYHKIIIMTDADVDGSHISTLILTLFFRHFKELVINGNIYLAMPPLYRIGKGKSAKYVYTDEEKEEYFKSHEGKNLEVQRYKGLGEMNADQLWETTMNPETRYLKKITVESMAESDRIFSMLMGEKVEPRKEFILENAKFVKELDI